jgi:kynurenine formamidase
MNTLSGALARATLIDLTHDYHPGIPHWPTHPPYAYTLTKLHGEQTAAGGVSSASDLIALGAHNGTHIDALCHFSQHGRLCGGIDVAPLQSYTGGIAVHHAALIPPIACRGVLLDFGELPADHEITAAEMERAERNAGVEIQAGDVVLLRTGWARFWPDPQKYINGMRHPGPGLEAAHWLTARGIIAAGADTPAFERVPAPSMPVHVHFLVDKGIYLIENLDLDQLARTSARVFAFIAAPLKLSGATGAPVRAFALQEE